MEDDALDSSQGSDEDDELDKVGSSGESDGDVPVLSEEASTLLNKLVFATKALPKHSWDTTVEENFIDLYKLAPEVEKPIEAISILMPRLNQFAYKRNKVLIKLQLNIFNLLRSSLGAVRSVGSGESPFICMEALINKMLEIYCKIETQREMDAFGIREDIQEVLETPRGRERVNELKEHIQMMDELQKFKRVGSKPFTPSLRGSSFQSSRGGSTFRGSTSQNQRGRGAGNRGRGNFFWRGGKGRSASASPSPKKTGTGSH
jgi:hypothetical protein